MPSCGLVLPSSLLSMFGNFLCWLLLQDSFFFFFFVGIRKMDYGGVSKKKGNMLAICIHFFSKGDFH